MIKAIIFDFDGVILESADIKTEAFRELFSAYSSDTKDIVDYHIANGGLSRYVKFRYIFKNMLKQDLSEKDEKALGIRFSQIALQKVLKAPFVKGAKDFLEMNKSKYKYFIASGTPEGELLDIVLEKNLTNYFTEIHGSPSKKPDIIRAIMKKYNYLKNEVVYIGDADSDRVAAKEAEVTFIERNSKLISNSDCDTLVIKDLSDLNDLVDRL